MNENHHTPADNHSVPRDPNLSPDSIEQDASNVTPMDAAQSDALSSEADPSNVAADVDSGELEADDVLAAEQEENEIFTDAPARVLRPHGVENGRILAAAAARVAIDNNAQNVTVLDVCRQSAEFDFFVLATGTSRRQLHAISEQIDDVLEKELQDRRLGIEGYEDSRWIVLDYGSVVIHLFDDETREFYDLESLWADGEVIPLEQLGLTPNSDRNR